MTFSLIGRCAETGMLGVAITTSSICVASRCPWARAGAGAVSTQNVTDPTIGPKVLDLLAGGKSAAEALQAVLAASQYAEYRQVTVIDRQGRTAHHSGSKTLGTNGVAVGKDCVPRAISLPIPTCPRRWRRSSRPIPTCISPSA